MNNKRAKTYCALLYVKYVLAKKQSISTILNPHNKPMK